MIAIDSNILVYAHRSDSRWYERANHCIKELAEGRTAWAIPWPCVHEFLSIVTHPRIYGPPSTIEEAVNQIEAWFESGSLTLMCESPTYWKNLKEVLSKSKVVGGTVHDARIAALCIDNAVDCLYSADRDFSRFSDLKTVNPLVR